MLTPVGETPHPYVCTQSLPSRALRSGLRYAACLFPVQSLPDKEVDSVQAGTFFMLRFILEDKAEAEYNAGNIEDEGKILGWVRTQFRAGRMRG
jgi:hypothetical protein